MIRSFCLGALFAAAVGFVYTSASASGSIGPGPGKISPRAAYSQGKKLTFDALACGDCPLQRNELDADRARSLTASLEAAYDGNTTGSPDDEAVQALCGPGIDDCDIRMEVVHYFLTRRYKL